MIYEALYRWLLSCPYARNPAFSQALGEPGEVLLRPAGPEVVLGRYLDGSTLRRATFQLLLWTCAADSPGEPGALHALDDARRVDAWMRAAIARGEGPRLPDGCALHALREGDGYDLPAEPTGDGALKLSGTWAADYLEAAPDASGA